MPPPASPAAETQPFPPTQPIRTGAAVPRGAGDPDGLADWREQPRKTAFTTSMRADLRKLADAPQHCNALAVVAASVRHSHPMAMKLQVRDRVTTLAVFPRLRQFRCEVDLCTLAPAQMAQLRLVQVEQVPPLEPSLGPAGRLGLGPLSPMLWHLAKYGPTEALLPEIAGPAVYRVSPSLQLASLPPDPEVMAVLKQMRRRPLLLEDLAQSPGFSRARACRLLNAVYLQAGLIVSRSLPKLWS
jgi:hypothetical protein